jgi:hypothetical protein
LVGVTPGGLELLFAEREGADPKRNRALMERYRLEVVGPPLR